MESLKENDFQWIGQRGAAATQYGAGWFAREGFQLVKNDSSDPILRCGRTHGSPPYHSCFWRRQSGSHTTSWWHCRQYLVGSYVRVPIRSRDDLEGEVR